MSGRELILERDDANSESALLVEWLVDDRSRVRRGQPICVVQTSKAVTELEAPRDGWVSRGWPAGADVPFGAALARIFESEDQLGRDSVDPLAVGAEVTGERRLTRAAAELVERHRIDPGSLPRRGFVTAADVEALIPRGERVPAPAAASVDESGVTLPAGWSDSGGAGRLDRRLRERLTSDRGFGALESAEKLRLYREAGAVIGEGVVLGDGVVLDAERVVLGDGVQIEAGGSLLCREQISIGALTHIGPRGEVRGRRFVLGENVHAGRDVRVGGGGHRDPWADFAAGDRCFLGDEVFINICRPVLLGREVFVTQRAMLVTHNIGHSVLEGFENRFAPIVIEDRAQVGLGAVVYAGCRLGREAVLGSNSYAVSSVPEGKLAMGVPARVVGVSRREPSRAEQLRIARRMLAELAELLSGHGCRVEPLGPGHEGLAISTPRVRAALCFVERLTPATELPAGFDEIHVWCLETDEETDGGGSDERRQRDPFEGVVGGGGSVFDLVGRRLRGPQSELQDAIREFLRKRGIRFSPEPWRYRRGLI